MSATQLRSRPPSAVTSGSDFTNSVSTSRVVLCPWQGTAEEDASITHEYPLSFGQERLWFLHQLASGTPVYNVSTGVEIQGDLKIEALREAFNYLVERHEALRTNFAESEDRLVQTIQSPRPVELPVFNLRSVPSGDAEIRTQRIKDEVSRAPFDLVRDLMIRAALITQNVESHLLIVVIHHIAVDRWSLGILLQELFDAYRALSRRDEPRHPPVSLRYVEYARWQQQWMQGTAMEKQLSYWKRQLTGMPDKHHVMLDRRRPQRPAFRGARESTHIPENATARLMALSQRERSSLFMVMLAGFQCVLHRYSGQDDIVVGFPIANRNRQKVEKAVGLYINTLVLRTDFSGNPTFREVLSRVREVAFGAYDHQDLPFEKVVDALQADRGNGENPLFQTLFVFQNDPVQGIDCPGLTIDWNDLSTGTSKLDLMIWVEQKNSELRVTLEYDSDLFEPQTIQRLLDHFRNVLEFVTQHPETRVGQVPMLGEGERRLLLVECNDTKRPYPQRCVHELFEEQVERRSEAVAVAFGERTLSYGQLNRNANAIASELMNLGISPDTRVGICAERSLEVIAGLIGILKAGGAYVPLDPAYPDERLEFLAKDASLEVILGQEGCLHRVRHLAKHVVSIESLLNASEGHDFPKVPSAASPDNLAYVLYTSGSTGTPKGVEVRHRSIARLIFDGQFAELDETKVFLQLAPLSFDLSTLEIWGPLLHGGCCALFPGRVPAARELGQALRTHRVTTLWLTSSLFNAIVDQAPQELATVKQLLIGGEALSVPHVHHALHMLPNTEIINGYGPTEATTFATTYSIPGDLDPDSNSVPIGRPIGNTDIYVLDSHLQPVPIGAPGELYIGGDGLARGYLNRSELTEKSFIAHPFDNTPGARLYSSGDVARYRLDGNLEFLGRKDGQVKLRGFRIELGEIEAVLHGHPAVKAAALTVVDGVGGKRLVAYSVKREQHACDAEQLRDYLADKLPQFMVPAQFVFLHELPLTASGKVDRRRLPKPELAVTTESDSTEPRDSTEAALLEIWRKLLGTRQAGVTSNFFELGGNSLLAARLISQVERTLGKKLAIADLFQAPTIDGLAKLLRNPRKRSLPERLVPIQPEGSNAPFFCIGAGPFFNPLGEKLAPDQPFLGVDVDGLDPRQLRAPYSLPEIAKTLTKAIREYQPRGPYLLGGWCFNGIIAYEVAQQLRGEGQEVALLVMVDSQNPAHDGPRNKRLNHLPEKLRYHFANLRQTGFRGTPSYVLSYVRSVIDEHRRAAWRWSYKAFRRLHHTEHILYVAVKGYRPQRYNGRIAFLKATVRSPGVVEDEITWEGIATGYTGSYDVPGDHRTIFQEPNVGVLADTLLTCIKEAQRTPVAQ